MKIKEMIHKIIDSGNTEKMYKLNEMLDDLICDLKETDPEKYKEYKMCLYEMAYGKVLNEEMAEKWVKDMKPVGLHFTMEETTNAMRQMGYNCDQLDYFVACNMMYNDYFKTVKDDNELTFKLAYEWLDDEDAVKDKLYDYWKYIVKKD